MNQNYHCGRPQLNQQEENRTKSVLNFMPLLIIAIDQSRSTIARTVQIGIGSTKNSYTSFNYNFSQTIYFSAALI